MVKLAENEAANKERKRIVGSRSKQAFLLYKLFIIKVINL